MEKSKYEQGLAELKKITGAGIEDVIQSMEDIAPDIGTYLVEFAGNVFAREGLSLRERELVTVASLLTAGGCESQLEIHINGALNVGIPPQKIVELFVQCIAYTGYPRVLNAVSVAKKVFGERNLSLHTEEAIL